MANEFRSTTKGIDVVSASGRVGDPAIWHGAVAAHPRNLILNLIISGVSFLHRLRQTRICHSVKDMANALRIVLFQHLQDLATKLFNLRFGAAATFYLAGLDKICSCCTQPTGVEKSTGVLAGQKPSSIRLHEDSLLPCRWMSVDAQEPQFARILLRREFKIPAIGEADNIVRHIALRRASSSGVIS
jgi:hypothetical protein